MSQYRYLDNDFLSESAINIIKEYAKLDDERFIEKVKLLELQSIGYIKSVINLKKLEKDEYGKEILKGLCTSYTSSKLYQMIAHTDYIELANDIIIDFRTTLAEIKSSQIEEGTNLDEEKPSKKFSLFVR